MRHILKLQRSLDDLIAPIEAGFEISTFLPELEKNEWLELNNIIFTGHPDQGNWSLPDLENRMKERWFAADGFFIAKCEQKIVGFCWMKIHHALVNQDPVGEIYVIGIAPDFKKKGLGRVLASTGLKYLSDKKLKSAMLYVDADNQAALAMYQSLGFN
jgi:mycothiol synthase